MEIEQIYNMYFKDVFRYVYSMTKNQSLSEEITQDAFLKALKNIEKYDGRKDIRAWLFTIARNTLYTYYKREKIYVPEENTLEEGTKGDLSDVIIQKEIVKSIEYIIDKLSEPYGQVFKLRQNGGLAYEEISKMYGKSLGWARIIFYRAKKQILEQLEEKEWT